MQDWISFFLHKQEKGYSKRLTIWVLESKILCPITRSDNPIIDQLYMESRGKWHFLIDLSCWTGSAKRRPMLWSVRDLFSMAQAAQVYFKIYRQWQVSKSNNSMAVKYNPGLSIVIPSLGASHWNDCLLSPIGMKLHKIAKEQALIPYITLDCFSEALRGYPWVTLGEKRKMSNSNTTTNSRCKNLF